MKEKDKDILEEVEDKNLNIDNETLENPSPVVVKKKCEWPKKIFLGLAYSIIPFLFFLIVQQLSWTGNMILGKPGAHPEIWLDDKIPIVSEFVWIYFLTFPVAIFTYFLVAYKDKKHLWNLWLTLMISFAISGIIYFFWQTEMVKPELEPITLSDKFLLWTWGSCNPICCLPSQHCFMAFGIIIGVYNQKKNINPWLRWSLIVCGILIVFSTVFLKQHYVLDIVASFVIMIPTFVIVKYTKFGDHMVKKYGDWVWFGKNNKNKKESVVVQNELNLESENILQNTNITDDNINKVSNKISEDDTTIVNKNQVEEETVVENNIENSENVSLNDENKK